MSAYVVSKTHIATLVKAAMRDQHLRWFSEDAYDVWEQAEGGYEEKSKALAAVTHTVSNEEDAIRVCRLLTTAIVGGVKHRYPDDTDETLPGPIVKYWTDPNLDWARVLRGAPALTPTDLLQAIRGYTYQASELPRFDRTEAGRFLDALKDAAIGRLTRDSGSWSIEDPE